MRTKLSFLHIFYMTGVSQTAKLEGTLSKTAITLTLPGSLEDSKNHPNLVNLVVHQKGSQHSLKVIIILKIMIYDREIIHIKISQRKGNIRHSLGGFLRQSFRCPLPWSNDPLPSQHQYLTISMNWCQSFVGASLHRNNGLIDYPYD